MNCLAEERASLRSPWDYPAKTIAVAKRRRDIRDSNLGFRVVCAVPRTL